MSDRRTFQSFIPDRSLVLDAVGSSAFTPPAQSQSTAGQSNESLRIRPLLRCCNCTTGSQENISYRFQGCVERFSYFLPLSIRVEGNTVDRTEMPFDPSELLLIGSMEEPDRRWDMLYDEQCCIKRGISKRRIVLSHLASNFPILVEVVVTSMASWPPPITTWAKRGVINVFHGSQFKFTRCRGWTKMLPCFKILAICFNRQYVGLRDP